MKLQRRFNLGLSRACRCQAERHFSVPVPVLLIIADHTSAVAMENFGHVARTAVLLN